MKYSKKRKATSGKKANIQRVTMISRHAKRTRKKGEAWTKAIQRAIRELKKEGKLLWRESGIKTKPRPSC